MPRSTHNRYGTVAIAVHWLTAILILVMFFLGFSATKAAGTAAELPLLRTHVALGIFILAITLFRIGWWVFADTYPSPGDSTHPLARLLARLVHGLLYAVILLLASSGIATLIVSGAFPALAGTQALPDFNQFIPRDAHGILARLLIALALGHIGAALYHQFVARDRLLARMGIGTGDPA